MANKSNFRVIRGRSEAEAELSRKIRRHRIQSVLRIVLIAAIVTGLAAFLIIQYKNQVFSGYVITRHGEMTALESTSYLENDNSVIRYS